MLKDKAAHVHRVARGGVVHGLVLRVGLVVQHGGAVRPALMQEGSAFKLMHSIALLGFLTPQREEARLI